MATTWRRSISRLREGYGAMTLPAFTACATKAGMVGAPSRLPSLRLQRLAALVMRRVWPAFREA